MITRQQPLTVYFPGKLVFGNGVLAQLQEDLLGWQPKRVLVVTIPPLMPSLASLFSFLEMEQIQVMTDTSVANEPGFADFERLLELTVPFNPDVVVGIGGGSVLDIAKLLAAQIGNEQVLTDYVGIGLLKRRPKKLVCVPSTAGTGSEVSPNAILVDEADNQKKGIISPFLVPDAVYVDPLLTLSVPASITAATGIDALTHCLEAYTNKHAQPFIDLYALEGIRLIAANIENAVKDGNDAAARESVAMGSLLGGFCLGPVNTAGVHALSYPLGSMFHLAHGLSNALLLPYVLEYNIPAAPERYAAVAEALGCARTGDAITDASRGVLKIKSIISACGLPATLQQVNVPEDALAAMARDALRIQRLLQNNIRPIAEADALAIYQSAWV